MGKIFPYLGAIATALFILFEAYSFGYDNGYDRGQTLGYSSGYEDSFERLDDRALESEVYGEIMLIELEVADEYGYTPYEASEIIDDYLSGKSVSKSDLVKAMNSICGYYEFSLDLPDRCSDFDMID